MLLPPLRQQQFLPMLQTQSSRFISARDLSAGGSLHATQTDQASVGTSDTVNITCLRRELVVNVYNLQCPADGEVLEGF